MGVDQLDEPELLGQRIEEGRGPKLSELHGPECRHLLWGGRGALGMYLFHDPLPGAQVELLDNARVAMDPSGADPIEVRLAFFPFSDQTWHNNGRVTGIEKNINMYQ